MNNITFVGNLVADAEVKDVGKSKCISFRVADNVGFGDKKLTNFYGVSYFKNQEPEKLAVHLLKGRQVMVVGEFQARPYKAKDGTDKLSMDVRATSVNFVGGTGEEGGKAAAPASQAAAPDAPASTPAPAAPAAADNNAF
jgi:single-stranded DNA-binding protein